MGRKGWAGTPPVDDAEARKRIIDATLHSIERRGPQQTSLSEVASELGVTRPTIYRYFSTIDELMAAAAETALSGWTARIAELTAPTSLSGCRRSRCWGCCWKRIVPG